ELVHTILEQYGYTVLESSNGREALLICQRHQGPIHLLVTDVVMPEMNGSDLARRLALLQPEIKVLFLSGYTNSAILRHGVLERDCAYLQKPFAPTTLVRKVRDVLDAPRQPAPARVEAVGVGK